MITFVSYPLSINRLNITSVYELQILALAASLPDGLKQSNNQLAELLCTSSRTIINSINRLKCRGFVVNTGNKYHRTLTASSEIVSLFNSENVSLNSESFSLNSEAGFTHNISNISNINNTTANSEYSFGLKTGESWHLPQAKLDEYRESFPDIDLDRELKKARQWLQDNAGKRKTAQGMPRFLGSWLGRVKPEAILTPQANDYDWTPEELDAHLREIGVL